MRERTPSADDNPKRAPPAPLREAASADVTGSKTSSEPNRPSKFSPATTASSTSASSPSASVDVRMVASTHNLDELSASHPTSASSDRQQQQEKHGHAYRSAQTAQDKRSRLSNVINNLRKKVPDSRNGDSPKKEEDDRNSVERNLETLEKYVMTVLNGVIKDEEDDDREANRKKEEKANDSKKLSGEQEDEDSKGPAAKFEPSKPNESRTEAAVFSSTHSEKPEVKEPCVEHRKLEVRESDSPLKEAKIGSESKETNDDFREENEAVDQDKCSSRETKPDDAVQETTKVDAQEEEKKENRSLGTIIMERLSEHQAEDKAITEAAKDETREFVPENVELRNVCRDLLNDLLNGINQLIDEKSQTKEETRVSDGSSEENKDTKGHDLSMTSLHCSLPLDKVASVLPNCQTSELVPPQSPSSSSSSSSSQGSKSPCKPTSPTVRHLCLYCDRKFLSISLRQRHTERVHQQGGGRRSERNSRRPSQNCQYCSDKCSESLESLFHHMAGSHGDKYYACVQCSTRYLTREALVGHMNENHVERNLQIQEKAKEPSPCKEVGNQSPRERPDPLSPKEKRQDESDHEHRAESTLLKSVVTIKDSFSSPGSPEFDSSFYSSVSCNIRENLLHHLDGKLQSSSTTVSTTSSAIDCKFQMQQQQTYYEHSANQIQFPIDISLTAATPVYSKDYANEEYENNSEYAQKAGKRNRSHPRRVSFEKYNFPRKYDGKEQWTCSIKDLSKFDISTQLSLRKKQQLLKERITLSRLHQISILNTSKTTDVPQNEQDLDSRNREESKSVGETSAGKNGENVGQTTRCEVTKSTEYKVDVAEAVSPRATEFSSEFGSFLRLKKWDERTANEVAKKQETVYAELTGEWSRPRIYICGACATKHVTLREMEEHKVISHPNVWCSHFEFSGDQRELYKHLFLPGRNVPTAKAKAAILAEKVCTKCTKNCATLSELHRHMLECGGDQAWLLGLFGNGKKKCKWRPFGSRSRRRRQRGMKRNIQNSQTPRVNTPKEKQPTGPRVRPSDRESIQKMLANLPPKRATRKVLQDSSMRTQGRLRNVQTRNRQRMVGDNSTASRMSRNKAVLRNKLLKNAKSIQRNRCRIDNVSAVIESVVKNYHPDSQTSDNEDTVQRNSANKETKEKSIDNRLPNFAAEEKSTRTKVGRGPRVLGKKRNVKTKDGATKSLDQAKRTGSLKAKVKGALKNAVDTMAESSGESMKAPKGVKASPKNIEKEIDAAASEASPLDSKSPNPSMKNKSSAQTTPKRKRPVDPVASLNASIKAKSQLRTQDGKFAKNPNKDQSPVKSSETKSPVLGRQLSKEKLNETNPESSGTRSKLRTVSRNRNSDQHPKRTTRLSSDSDKMPTLEPATQIPANNEDYTETTAIDLPILSPVTPASSSEKISRGKNLVGKGAAKKLNETVETKGKGETVAVVSEENREQKQTKGRRAKSDGKNLEKNVAGKTEASKEGVKGKEKLKRRSAPAKMLTVDEKKTAAKAVEETSTKKEAKQKKEEGTIKSLDSRSNSKSRTEKATDEDTIKIANVPFEVKKLIGDNKEDLLNKLILPSLTTAPKRCLRQPMSKTKTGQGRGKVRRDTQQELEKKADSGSMSDASTKKEKLEVRRKSLRSIERKSENKTAKDDEVEEAGKICEAVNEVKAAVKSRRSSSLSNDSKSTMNTAQASSDNQMKTDVEGSVQNVDKRQTRGSLVNFYEEQSEPSDAPQKKSTYTGKRRGRVKSSINEKKNAEVTQKNEEAGKSEPTDKPCPNENELNSNNKDDTLPEGNVAKDKQRNEDVANEEPQKCPDASETKKANKLNLNANHLQVETSNSVDSGKENSLETQAPVQKTKVGRPRKSWGGKRERTSKRSLNNVIGILTEGVNIPAETQQTAPVASQPLLDTVNPEETSDNGAQPGDDSKSPDKSDKVAEDTGTETADDSKSSVERSTDDSSPLSASKSDKIDQDSQKQRTEEADIPFQNSEGEPPQSEALQTSENDSVVQSVSVENRKEQVPAKDTKGQLPTDDIILDLSRRKQKGKGSFLEKIVSKIAKQKDALLEGEVGSLLDTAADELTSILDEVGPALSEVAENAKTDAEQKVQERVKEVKKKSDENSANIENKRTEKEDTTLKQSEEKQINNGTGSENKINSSDLASDELILSNKDKSSSQHIDEVKSEEKKIESLPNTNTSTDDQPNDDEVTVDQTEPQITSKEACEAEIPVVSEDPEDNEVTDPESDHGFNELMSKTRKNKELHRRTKGKKGAAKGNVADESRDSENEDKTEMQSKSKIVKSVFGRVLSVEKTDKIKEVLNDSSKAENDSNLPKSDIASTSSAKADTEETAQTKDEDKSSKKPSVASSAPPVVKKRPGRKPKDTSSIDKTIASNPVSENQEERSSKLPRSRNSSGNRKKNEQDSSNCYFLAVPTNRSRQSKKIAEERICRSLYPGIEPRETNYELRSQSKSDYSIKDRDYGSFGNDEEFSKIMTLEDNFKQDQMLMKDVESKDAVSDEEKTSPEDPVKEICDAEDLREKVVEELTDSVEPNQPNPEWDEDSSLEVQKETSICDAQVAEESVCEPSSVVNEIPPPSVQNISEEKKSREIVSEETKVKTKSKKRSLEGNSPKKNKRKSVEPVENTEENLLPEELDLTDIMELIDKSKQVPSTNENFDDDLSTEERIQCGKRKTISEDSVLKDSDSKMTLGAQVAEESIETVKKRKVDPEEDVEDKTTDNKMSEVGGGTNSANDSVETTIAKVKEKINDEDKCPSPLKIVGKRKSVAESVEYCQKSVSPVRRTSKRRSIYDEKANQPSKEDTEQSESEFVEATDSVGSELTPEITRRRSSRTKSVNQLRNEEKNQETTEEESKVAEEGPTLENAESQNEQNTQDLPQTNLAEPENPVEAPVKVAKKRGRKKKILTNVPTEVTDKSNEENSQLKIKDAAPATMDPVPRRSLRTNRSNEETEEQNKNPNDLTKSHAASPNLEPFKVPEVTEVLQHTKKRTYKRRSTTEEHLDVQINASPVEPEANSTKCSDTNKSSEKEEQPHNFCQKDTSESRPRSSRSFHQLGLERSTSSGSIDLIQTNRTRSSKRKQLSSENLSSQESFNQRTESLDNLSETSCTSESSYFRKKRFSKKKVFQEPSEDVLTDTSITDSESMDTEKTTDRRQSLRRKAKENISFEDTAFDLVDYFDLPMDVQDCVSQEDAVESSINQEPEPEPEPEIELEREPEPEPEPEVDPEVEPAPELQAEEPHNEAATDAVVVQPEDANADEDKGVKVRKEPEIEEEESKDDEKADDKLEELAQAQDDFQTPKKRVAGNFVVVHKKTGEILIVEKRKKLTKEAARFFCDVCATSFTRKSSLKKHNQSQSHLLQVVKFQKDKLSVECKEGSEDSRSVCQNDVSSDENRSTTDEVNVSEKSKKDQKDNFLDSLYEQSDLKSIEDESSYTGTAEQEFMMDSQIARQRILEDELLDEEICKITENMSHDEYVLTDHVSPAPESTSTPIKMETTKTEEAGKKKKQEKKKGKIKKKNLGNEQITLDSSEIESPIDSSMINFLDTSMSMKTSKSELDDNDIEGALLADTVACSIAEECGFQEDAGVADLQESQDMDSAKLKEQETEKQKQMNYELNLDIESGSFNDAAATSNDKESHPERLSLKLTINKRTIENSKEQDARLDDLVMMAKEEEAKSANLLDSFNNPVKEINRLESEINQLEMYLGSSKKIENRKNIGNAEDYDAFKIRSLEEDLAKHDPAAIDDKFENEKQSGSLKETRHGRSKKGKSKKHLEEIKDSTEPLSKSKNDQGNQVLSESINSQKSTDDSKTLEYNDENPELLLYDSQPESKSIKENSEDISSRAEHESNELEITEDLKSLAEAVLKQSTEEQRVDEERNDCRNESNFHSIDDEEASSSSSLAHKPLAQLLQGTTIEINKDQSSEQEVFMDSDDELRSEQKLEEKNVENSPDTGTIIDDHKNNEKKVEQMEAQITSEEECEAEIPKIVNEDSKKDKVSLQPETNEVLENKVYDNTNDVKAANNNQKSNDGQGTNEKVSKARRYSNKEGRRRSKGKRATVKSRIANLTSESEDSENEDKMELQNKSKIVKSVFGRVFGGEKTDKVKEVLNDWVSKSEDDSDLSRSDFRSSSPNEATVEETSEARNEDRSSKRHSVSSVSSGTKKKSGKKSKEGFPSDRTKENVSEDKHAKSKNGTGNRRKPEEEPSDYYFLVLPPNKSRHSKKIAEERISRAFDGVRMFEEFLSGEQKETNYGLRSQNKPDLTVKDSGYGSFNYDEDSSKMVCSEEPLDEEQKMLKRRKSSSSRTGKSKSDGEDWKDLVMEMTSLKDSKEPTDEEDNSIRDVAEEEPAGAKSRSCSSLVPRSPSVDRNSQSTRDSDDEDEDVGQGRISPLFVRETPGSSIESSSNSENEDEDENMVADEVIMRKRSSSEFSGEKIVIRSPSSTHKGEVVTIAPTDAIEDNALDVPQEIETAKPRQGKVLNFDEELFVECCSRLKATTENELRGAKKIKLDHNEVYHRKDDQQQGLRGPRDRWRDVESQNSLGSLLESVNQLLGEEMYSTKETDYPKRSSRSMRSEHSSRSASPDMSRADNLGYEDSLDVAFEHNNKLRDKIQQRMRESENLIASTFGKSSNDIDGKNENDEQNLLRNSYSHLQDQGHMSNASLSNRSYNDALHVRSSQEQNTAKMNLDSGFKNKMNSSLGGLLDKALSNLLHSNGKHDHNGSTPMKVLAELACARAPTSTTGVPISQKVIQPVKALVNKEPVPDPCPIAAPKDILKKPRNPIKELFERKKEMNERKQQEKSKTEAAIRELNVHRQRKTKKVKKHQDFPLIRRGEQGGGLVEKKKRRDGFDKKEEFSSNRIKDVYDFDEEESQIGPNLGSVMSYRSRPGYEVSCLRTKDVDVAGLMSKAIGDSLENGKTGDALSSRLESMIDRKFKELEKFAPKTKGALKSFQSEDQRQITGPMDEFVERKQIKSKRPVEQPIKHSKLKKRNKNLKKKNSRNAWYENDSSDEYRTSAVKADDIGVGISKSQRTCSKGKQNIFAELYTSSESEFEHEGVNYESKKQRRVKKATKKTAESDTPKLSPQVVNKYSSENEEHMDEWRDQDLKSDAGKESDNKKSESEMSDHPLVIDERKEVDDQRNSDEETETQYERNYEMDDLYREDSSVIDSDVEDSAATEAQTVPEESRVKGSVSLQEKANGKASCMPENELIPLEEALDMLDQANNETPLEKYSNGSKSVKTAEPIDPVITEPEVIETFDPVEEMPVKSPSPVDDQEQEEEPDNDLLSLPEKLSSNEKPQKESDNLPLHVFLSRKVQESKKRKEEQLKKMQEEQERILLDFQPTRRQRKCAIGKQGLLAEISSSDEEISPRVRRNSDKSDHDKPRKQKRESKEKRKERYIEKKHEQMIAKEQKAIEEEILRELGKKKDSLAQSIQNDSNDPENTESADDKGDQEASQKKKHQTKEKQKKSNKADENYAKNNTEGPDDSESNYNDSGSTENNHEEERNQESSPMKQKKHLKSPTKPKKTSKPDTKVAASKKTKNANTDKSKNRTETKGPKDKERRTSNGKHDSDDEELKTTKSWNKVEEGVGVAIGRRKRAAANQLYYWSSSSDEEDMLEMVPVVEEEEDDRQEQHGWIVGDSHKRMITMLAMEKQLKEKRRRSEDEFEPSRAKSKKHRNSTS